jgi:hypothetical protein
MNDMLNLIDRWSSAEEKGDPTLLDGLLTEQFVGVGPLGFVLNREQWLKRFHNGLDNRAFAVTHTQMRPPGP